MRPAEALLLISGGLTCVLLAACDSPAAPAASTETRTASLTPSVLDLGEHVWGTKLPFVVELTNDEALPITIASINTGCECTVADEDHVGKRVEPHTKRQISLSMNLKDTDGENFRDVSINLADGRTLTSRIRVETLATYHLSETELDFGLVDPMDPNARAHERVVSFQSEYGVTLLPPVESDCDWLTIRLAGDSIILHADATKLRLGDSRANALVRTTDEVRVLSSIRVRIRADTPIAVNRPRVSLFNDAVETVQVTDKGMRLVEISDVRCDRAEVECTIANPGAVRIRNRSGERFATARVTVTDTQDHSTVVWVHGFID